jgi:HD-GYP domain-containing protein (c-di-GMP phosphodiesterase class II)
MSKALLLSNNQVLNHLYTSNLKIFVDVDVVVKHDIFEALSFIENSTDLDLILCLEKKSESETIAELTRKLKVSGLKIPLIVVGQPNDASTDEIITISNQFAIRELLRLVAKTLGVTAKEMVKKNVPKFYPIPLTIIQEMQISNCDIYFLNEKESADHEYYLIIKSNESVSGKIKKIIDTGIESLYVKAEDRVKLINHMTEAIIQALNQEDLIIEDRIKVLQESYTFLSEQIYLMHETPKNLQKISDACTQSFKKIITEIPNILNLIEMLLSAKKDYVYYHSIVGAYIGSKIIEQMDWGNKEQQEKISFVMFFHDIFLTPVLKKYPLQSQEEELIYNAELSLEDKNIVLEHAKMASEMVRNFSRLPMGADLIMLQHHGMSNGIGFANNFKDDISPLAKVILIAEDIASYIYDCSKKNLSINQEIDQLIETLRAKYRNHTYQKIIDGFSKIKI